MDSPNRKIPFAAAIAAFAILAAGGLWYWTTSRVNYLIPGVPYHGYYTHLFEGFASPVTAATTIFDYYGDERFSIRQLMKEQYYDYLDSLWYSVDDFEIFFRSKGYAVTRWQGPQRGALRFLRRHINQQSNTPVIALLRVNAESQTYSAQYDVVIGVSDKDKKILVHSHTHGNNYEITQAEFLRRLSPGGMMAVSPSEQLEPTLTGINPQATYPVRLKVMDAAAPFFAKRADIIDKQRAGNYDIGVAISLLEELTRDAEFYSLPPMAQIPIYFALVNRLIEADRPDEAISLLKGKVIPISSNVDQPYDGWRVDIKAVFPSLTQPVLPHPWVKLANAYAKKGDLTEARKQWTIALQYHPNYLAEIPPSPENLPQFSVR